jgi:hypothetical protein
MKKNARLTIRIPKDLKDKIDGIDRVYGVGLPKIANECLRAFCEYVEQRKQTPTFPISISPGEPAAKNLVANIRAFKADNEKEPEKLARSSSFHHQAQPGKSP